MLYVNKKSNEVILTSFNVSPEHDRIIQVNSGNIGPVQWPQYKTKQNGSVVLPPSHLKPAVVIRQDSQECFNYSKPCDADPGIGSSSHQPDFL